MNELREKLNKAAEGFGAKAFGIADIGILQDNNNSILTDITGKYSRAVVCGLRLQQTALHEIKDRPTPIYFHNYRQTNYQLDRLAWELADMIQEKGFEALAVPASQIIKRNPMCGHVSHKELGRLAGIGFIGKNNLLIHPEYGAQMRYVSVLTSALLEPDQPYSGEKCGTCDACRKACPANAIEHTRENFNLDACYKKLNEFTGIPYIGQHICGVCVKACGPRRKKR